MGTQVQTGNRHRRIIVWSLLLLVTLTLLLPLIPYAFAYVSPEAGGVPNPGAEFGFLSGNQFKIGSLFFQHHI